MARRKTSRPDYAGPDEVGEVPRWVLSGNSVMAAIDRIRADPSIVDRTPAGQNPIYVEARRNGYAAQAWCAERGLSYCLTVLGAAKPAPDEVATGCTRGAGPKYERMQAWLREHRPG